MDENATARLDNQGDALRRAFGTRASIESVYRVTGDFGCRHALLFIIDDEATGSVFTFIGNPVAATVFAEPGGNVTFVGDGVSVAVRACSEAQITSVRYVVVVAVKTCNDTLWARGDLVTVADAIEITVLVDGIRFINVYGPVVVAIRLACVVYAVFRVGVTETSWRWCSLRRLAFTGQ